MKPTGQVLHAKDWEVRACPLADGKEMVRRLHYSKGGSNTATDMHGLYRKENGVLCGVAWWLPPTRVAAESVNKLEWKRVVALSRLVVDPCVPTNGASFLLAGSVRILRREKRWVSLVTYADESQGHTGAIYKACNWVYMGQTGPYPRWLALDGSQVACKATVSRTKAEMEALGHTLVGKFKKHKFVLHLDDRGPATETTNNPL